MRSQTSGNMASRHSFDNETSDIFPIEADPKECHSFDNQLDVFGVEFTEVLTMTEEGKYILGKKELIIKSKDLDDFFNPGGRDDVGWCMLCKKPTPKQHSYGKWLIFQDYDKISTTWKDIVIAITEDKLEGCTTAKTTTLFYNPTCAGPGPCTNGVISVYTFKDSMDAIGYKLIHMVKQDIKYKTNEATLSYKYTHVGEVATIKTLYYNQGHPSAKLIGERKCGTTLDKEDIWHVNEVINSKMQDHKSEYGWWILTLEYKNLTHFWHLLKRKIESGKIKALRMVCPAKRRRSYRDEEPVFHVYTDEENAKAVGSSLILEVRRDIMYEMNGSYSHIKTLYWNEGEYCYEKITRKGITKNWRTGKDM